MPAAQLILHDTGVTNEIVAIMLFDNIAQYNIHPCRIIITCTSSLEQYIPTTSHLWESLSYPLLFPHGLLNWGHQGSIEDINDNYLPAVGLHTDAPSS